MEKANKINKPKKQQGFALIEVMIAALVLTVGGVAYMKLQQTGLQYGFNNAARSQGVALATGFIEQLRSNVGYLRTNGLAANTSSPTPIKGSFKAGKADEPTDEVNCDSSANTKACSEAIFSLHSYLTSEQMKSITPEDNSLLCYEESPTNAGFIRVTFRWRDNSKDGKSINLSTCPEFSDDLEQNNSVTIYAQI